MNNAGPCIKCRSTDTDFLDGDDGHFRKRCDDCGHVGGPYTSSYDEPREEQAGRSDFF